MAASWDLGLARTFFRFRVRSEAVHLFLGSLWLATRPFGSQVHSPNVFASRRLTCKSPAAHLALIRFFTGVPTHVNRQSARPSECF